MNTKKIESIIRSIQHYSAEIDMLKEAIDMLKEAIKMNLSIIADIQKPLEECLPFAVGDILIDKKTNEAISIAALELLEWETISTVYIQILRYCSINGKTLFGIVSFDFMNPDNFRYKIFHP